MAKGKSAAALFEVIHGGDRSKSAEAKLDTPKWWFKSRKRDYSVSAPIDVVAPSPAPTPIDHFPEPSSSSGGSGRSFGAFKFILPSSHTVALGLMLAATFGVGFVVGQRFHPVGSPVIAEESTEELLAGAANSSVLEVGNDNPLSPVQKEDPTPTANASLVPSRANPQPTLDGTLPPTTSVIESSQRTIGLNYVIVQSYPDEADALKAVQILADHHITTTVVKGPPGWAQPTWFSVVGNKGFSRIRGVAEFDLYVAAINKVSAKFAGRSKFKEFTPRAYKWKTAEPTVTSAQ